MYILFSEKEQKLDSGLIRNTNVHPLISKLLKLKQYKSDIYPQRIVVFKSGAKVVKNNRLFLWFEIKWERLRLYTLKQN